MTNSTHTPGPWTVRNVNRYGELADSKGRFFAHMRFWNRGVDAQDEILNFIVTACNAHADLLAALEAISDAADNPRRCHFGTMPVGAGDLGSGYSFARRDWLDLIRIARAAIRNARGEE